MRVPLQDTAEYTELAALQLSLRNTAAHRRIQKTEHHDLPPITLHGQTPCAQRSCGLRCASSKANAAGRRARHGRTRSCGICISRLGKALCCCAPAPHVPCTCTAAQVAAVGGVLVAHAGLRRGPASSLAGCANTLHPAARRSPSTARLSRSLLSSTCLPHTTPTPAPTHHRPIHTKGASTRSSGIREERRPSRRVPPGRPVLPGRARATSRVRCSQVARRDARTHGARQGVGRRPFQGNRQHVYMVAERGPIPRAACMFACSPLARPTPGRRPQPPPRTLVPTWAGRSAAIVALGGCRGARRRPWCSTRHSSGVCLGAQAGAALA